MTRTWGPLQIVLLLWGKTQELPAFPESLGAPQIRRRGGPLYRAQPAEERGQEMPTTQSLWLMEWKEGETLFMNTKNFTVYRNLETSY